MRRAVALLAGPALALVAAAPGSAAEYQVGTDDRDSLNPIWVPSTLAIQPGDKVTWTFAASTLPHNLIASSPNWAKNEPSLPPGGPPTDWTFTAPGTYAYICTIHGSSMTGSVTVGDVPPPPPPPLSEQPFANDAPVTTTAPLALEVGGLDTRRPSVRAVRVSRRAGGAKVRFRVSERSVVTVRALRGRKTVKTRRAAASGRGSVTLRGLAAGQYRLRIGARDLAGNTSSTRTARITIR